MDPHVFSMEVKGSQLGPTLSMRGVDNAAYYRLSPEDPRNYLDFTGCGNSPNMQHPRVLQLIMDSLRYWVTEMHVDGFRFDLASTLARELFEVDRLGAFFDIIHQDPVLSQVKLIAEPWDVGTGGYQVGNFPVLWSEWNGKYRDTVRQFWKGDGGTLSEFATRLSGSSDLYQHDGRKPSASINFIICHDGFTLHDLVSYNDKHNDANGDDNQDGANDNHSWNCKAEGPTDDAAIRIRRTQPVFRRRKFFHDRAIHGEGIQDISWFDAAGQEMTEKDWHNGYVRCLGVRLAGDRIGGTDERGDLVVGDTVLLLMNAHHEAIPFMLPPLKKGQRWERVLDTAREPLPFEGEPPYELQGRTMAVLHTTLQHKQAWQALGTAPSNSTGEPHAERRDHAYRAPL